VDEEDIRSFLAALTREAQWVNVKAEIRACRDAKDDKFLELAVSGRATHLVTGDTDLLALSPFQGIEILPPIGFCRYRRRAPHFSKGRQMNGSEDPPLRKQGEKKEGHDVSCPYTVGEFETRMLVLLVMVAVGVFGGAL
jgi:hypothetical protein